ncbi:hypothetical protein CEY00_Acc18304 [Actinidia chinensis var. chinensis]|uniref:Uncharacterized protein n=1 Tax=Actinidia chinensis var. chinensis TaxID=1590841 RepID=A0A2R6QH45_ACTCC|nr:hypothetical protein CEY00_Acc18304 [Actinidia chinensis var. chinensis]
MEKALTKVGSIKAGTFWVSKKAKEEISNITQDLTTFSSTVEEKAKWVFNKLKDFLKHCRRESKMGVQQAERQAIEGLARSPPRVQPTSWNFLKHCRRESKMGVQQAERQAIEGLARSPPRVQPTSWLVSPEHNVLRI